MAPSRQMVELKTERAPERQPDRLHARSPHTRSRQLNSRRGRLATGAESPGLTCSNRFTAGSPADPAPASSRLPEPPLPFPPRRCALSTRRPPLPREGFGRRPPTPSSLWDRARGAGAQKAPGNKGIPGAAVCSHRSRVGAACGRRFLVT